MLESKNVLEEMDGVRNTIESGVVDVQTITILKRLLTQKNAPTASITISTTTKTGAPLNPRAKRNVKSTARTDSAQAVQDSFPGKDLISATKTIVMKSLLVLAMEVEKRTQKSDSVRPSTAVNCTRTPLSQGTRNIFSCCKLALEALRQWQENADIGYAWVNKAYFGYIGKVIALEMVRGITDSLTARPIQRSKTLQFLRQKLKNNFNLELQYQRPPARLQGGSFKIQQNRTSYRHRLPFSTHFRLCQYI
jgi:hypothetical protein